MVKTFFIYAIATIQATGPAGLLGVALLSIGLTTLFPHHVHVH
jgi:hypothetical protein